MNIKVYTTYQALSGKDKKIRFLSRGLRLKTCKTNRNL